MATLAETTYEQRIKAARLAINRGADPAITLSYVFWPTEKEFQQHLNYLERAQRPLAA